MKRLVTLYGIKAAVKSDGSNTRMKFACAGINAAIQMRSVAVCTQLAKLFSIGGKCPVLPFSPVRG
jgi:hypothetical protein